MKSYTLIFAAIFGAVFSSTAQADLILELGGENGSNVMTYTASGSIKVTQGFSSLTSGLGLGPGTTGNWTSSFDNNLGDFLRDGMNGAFNDDLALSNGGVSYRRNGTEFGVLDTLDLDGANGGGGDDVELDPTTNVNYPSLANGDIISWTGSGTFTLEDGETFDTLFTATGDFSNVIDGGNYTVRIVNNTAVPEPSSLLLMASGLAGYVVMRRRKKRAQESAEEQNAA